jgi:nucleoside-diphosphate-sugar epimerase
MYPIGEADTRAAIDRFSGIAGRIVGISSGDVYRAYGRLIGTEPGPPEPVPLKEDAPLRETLFPYRPTAASSSEWAYHYDKILAERALLNGSLPATVLRLPAVYGPGDPYRRLRPFLKRIEDERPVILLESHQAAWRWSHGYVEDVAAGIARAVLDDRAVGEVYNLGESVVPTMLERVQRLGHLRGWAGTVLPVRRDQLPHHLRPPYEPVQDLIMETGKIRSELDFRESLTEVEGLRRTIEWERIRGPAPDDPTDEEYAAEDACFAQLTN